MTTQEFVSLLSVMIAFVASLFFCMGSTEMKSHEINNLSGTFWDENPYLKKFLVSLKADYFCGALALCLAFFLQFTASVPGGIPSYQLFTKPNLGAGIVILVGIIFGGLLYIYKKSIEKDMHNKITSK